MLRTKSLFLVALVTLAVGSQVCSQSDFEPPVIYPVTVDAKTVAIGDLNADGRDDIALTAWQSRLYVLYQQANGLLSAPTEVYAPNLPGGIAIADLNADGMNDLAVGGSGGVIFLYYQLADGTLDLPTAAWGYGLVNSLVIGDFGGDGLADIVSTSSTLPVVLVTHQLSDGTFDLPVSFSIGGSNPRCIQTLDYNSDGASDLALLLDNEICCMSGLYGGGFEAPSYITASYAYGLAAGDVTGDGLDDLVYSVRAGGSYAAVGVVAQYSAGLAPYGISYPAYPYPGPLALADVSGDGRNDVVAAHAGWDAITVTHQNPDGTLGEWYSYSAPYCSIYEPQGLAVGDLNSDGQPDIALADQRNGLVVFLHTAGASPEPDTTPPTCTVNVSGDAGEDGWFLSDATVTVHAEDEPDGSGVSGIFLTSDGVNWSDYVGPIVISAQGQTRVGFCAEDNAGNRSETQWIVVKVDTVPPVLTIVSQITSLWPPNGAVIDVPVTVTADDAASGVSRLHLAVVDEYGLVQPEFDVTPGAAVYVPLVALRYDVDQDGRLYTLTLTGSDAAGNTASVSTTVIVPRSNSGKPKKPGKDK